MAHILAQPEIPTAVVTANDLTAIGALRTAHEKGLNIPGDISIAGCDDIEMSDIVFPPLTTLRISRKEYAGMLFKALQEAGKDLTQPGQKFTLTTRLVVRQSTGPVQAGNRRPTGRNPGRAVTRKAR
jgi:LacI family transcriptional regulator